MPPMSSIAVDHDPFAHGEIIRTAPTTESQREIWYSVQMGDDANCAYNESLSLHLHGELQTAALLKALHTLIQRHESLRMTVNADGTLLCVNQSQPWQWSEVDLSDLTQVERDRQLTDLRQDAVTTPFSLTYGPLFRAQLVKLSPQTFVLMLTAHHIICDGWSWGILIPELGKLYSAALQGIEPALPTPERFTGYAQAQATEQEEAEGKATLAYWQQQFHDTVPVLNLPTDFPRAAVRSFRGDRWDWELEPEIFTQLKQRASQSGVSLLTLLLASFEVFLSRLTGQADLVVGLPVAGQAMTGQTQLVGHAVHLLPLRSQVSPHTTFLAYLQERRTRLLDAFEHQAFTFGQLVRHLQLPRDPSRIPLVAVTFNLDKGFEAEHLPFENLAVACQTNPRTHENFELAINVTEYRYRLQFEWQYNPDLFQAETIQAWSNGFTQILKQLAEQPETRIADLPDFPRNINVTEATSHLPVPPLDSPQITAPIALKTTQLSLAEQSVSERSIIESSAIAASLAQIWQTLLGLDAVGLHDSFFDLGGNSMLAVQLFARVEKLTGHKLPLTTLFQSPTIAGLIQALQAHGWTAPAPSPEAPLALQTHGWTVPSPLPEAPLWSPLVPIQPQGSKPPFFCVHPHGGNVLCYRELGQFLSPDQPFYGLQAQGVDGKQPPLDRIEAMATLYLQAIRQVQPQGPYFLGGFCVGGYIAYEMAQQLQHQGETVGLLLAIDSDPTLVTAPTFSNKDLGFHWHNLKGRFQHQGIGPVLKSIGGYVNRNFIQAPDLEYQEFERMWQVHARAITRYVPQPYPGCLSLIFSQEWHQYYPDFAQKWGVWAKQVQPTYVPGTHDDLLTAPNVIAVAQQITEYLSRTYSHTGLARVQPRVQPITQ